MKITICGSIAFYAQMQKAATQLEAAGHEVKLPPATVKGEDGSEIYVTEYYRLRKAAGDESAWIWERKQEAMREHFEKVALADAILVLNEDKNNVPGYIGSNTFLEMGLAFYLRKGIYLRNAIPYQQCREELLAMSPQVLEGDLERVPA